MYLTSLLLQTETLDRPSSQPVLSFRPSDMAPSTKLRRNKGMGIRDQVELRPDQESGILPSPIQQLDKRIGYTDAVEESFEENYEQLTGEAVWEFAKSGSFQSRLRRVGFCRQAKEFAYRGSCRRRGSGAAFSETVVFKTRWGDW